MSFVDTKTGEVEERKVRYVDMKVGLPWLVSSASALVVSIASLAWSMSTASGRLEVLAGEVSKVERRLETRDERIERMALEVQSNRAVNDVQNQRLNHLEERERVRSAMQANR